MNRKKSSAWIGSWVIGLTFVGLIGLIGLKIMFSYIHWDAVEEILRHFYLNEGQLPCELKDYANVLIAVIAAIIAALLSISITMYVFLKSALDRVIDENHYIADVASVYQANTSTALFVTALANMAPLFLSLGWHFLLDFQSFDSVKDHKLFTWGIILLLLLFILGITTTVFFWLRCIRLKKRLKSVIKREKKDCSRAMDQFLAAEGSGKDNAKDAVWFLIGYWDKWMTDEIDPLIEKCGGRYKWDPSNPVMDEIKKHGQSLCAEMDSDQFINLFSRAEALLLSGANGVSSDSYDESTIVTVIQERQLISDPTIKVEKKDICDKRYRGGKSTEATVLDFICAFREKVGYRAEASPKVREAFFRETEQMYKCLRRYCNLILSERDAVTSGKRELETADSGKGRDKFSSISTCMYYLYLRIIALFINAVRIDDFTFNGNTLSLANFYNSSLSNVSFYDAQFYHTVFARTRLQQVTMDLSEFDNLFFYYTKFVSSSLNNSTFRDVIFENTQAVDTDLSICIFSDCEFLKSVMTHCIFNGSRFQQTILQETNLSQSQLCDITWVGTTIKDCSFEHTKIRGWTWETSDDICLTNCDFSGSIWEEMVVKNANMSNASFIGASLVGVYFKNTVLEETIFLKCQLPNAIFQSCERFSQSSFQEANLFGAEFHDCHLEKTNFYQSSASNSYFEHCNLQHSDCSAMYFRNARLLDVDFTAARLYNTTLNWAEIVKCNFTHTLSDHLQFTFAKCQNTSFAYASMSDSCLSGTHFEGCAFYGTDLSASSASKADFQNFKMTQADLTDTRFVDSAFAEGRMERCDLSRSRFDGGLFEGVPFNSCFFDQVVFSNISFQDVIFSDCSFDGIFFLQCTFERVSFIRCTVTSGGCKKEITLEQLKSSMDPICPNIIVEGGVYRI